MSHRSRSSATTDGGTAFDSDAVRQELAQIYIQGRLLSLTGYQFPDPIGTFYNHRDSGTRDYYSRGYVKLAKPEAGTLAQGTTGVGYRGTGPAMNDLIGGQFDVMCDQTTNTTNQIKDGRINTLIAVITPAHPSITEIALQNDIRFLALSADVVKTMREEFNYERQTMPGGMFRWMEKDVPTVGFPTVFITRQDVPDDLVYLVTKSIAENKEQLGAAHKGLAKFDPTVAWKRELVGLPLHPGAERFYREKGWMK